MSELPADRSALSTEGTLLEVLGMSYIELTKERVVMTMPVDARTKQPAGLLHGGASVALAETAASVGTWLHIDPLTQAAVGIEINANHVRSARDGHVQAVATVLHKGRTMMVWDVRITDQKERLLCVARCTVAIIDQAPPRETSLPKG
ncbi:MAG: hotdog fold thioesterase [Firmicutes bacterium]|nr:hotdog fold thioesterase [Bacillota bacterium]